MALPVVMFCVSFGLFITCCSAGLLQDYGPCPCKLKRTESKNKLFSPRQDKPDSGSILHFSFNPKHTVHTCVSLSACVCACVGLGVCVCVFVCFCVCVCLRVCLQSYYHAQETRSILYSVLSNNHPRQ